MSTQTQTDSVDDEQPAKQIATSAIEIVGGVGLLGSFLICSILAVFVLSEVLGGTFAEMPLWFIVSINTAVAVPIVVALTLTAGWLLSAVTGNSIKWKQCLLWGAALAVVLFPPYALVYELGYI